MHLGISGYFHDSSVALLSDNGELLDFKKEEWFSRVKGDKSFSETFSCRCFAL